MIIKEIKKNKKMVIYSILIFLTVNIYGQSNYSGSKSTNQFGITLGSTHHQVRDDIISPLRYDGFGYTGNLLYSLIGDKRQHNIDLRIVYASLLNRYSHKNKVAEFNLGYSYMYIIAGNDLHNQLQIGGLIDWIYNLQYYNNWDDSHIYWLNVYELSPAVRWSSIINDNQLTMDINFSLLALVSRPPKYRYYDTLKLAELYSETHENLKLTSLHEYVSFRLRGQYMFKVNEKIKIGVIYLLNYKTISKPERINLFTNSILFNLQFASGYIKKEKS